MNTNKVDWSAEVQSAVLAMKEEGQKAYTFMKSEAPEVAREYIAWKRAGSTVEVACFVMAASVLALIACKLWTKKPGIVKRYGEKVAEDMDGYRIRAVFLWCCASAVILALAASSPRIMKPWLAPRIAIIEGIKEVVR